MERKRNISKVIGITGGIGTGKTTVANYIESKGYKVISTDKLAKDILNNNKEVKEKIIRIFGEEAYVNETYNSHLIFEKIFGGEKLNENLLFELNKVVHPVVIEEMIKITEKFIKQKEELIFIESALIYEAGLEEGFDYIILVVANENKVIERLIKNRNLKEHQIRNVMQSQIPQQKKEQVADFVLVNDFDIATLQKNTDLILEIIR